MISFSFFIRFCHYNKQFCDSQVEHFSDSWGRQKQYALPFEKDSDKFKEFESS